MKKTTAVKGFTALAVLGFSVFNIEAIGSFYQWVTPTSSMVGQEVWLVLALVVGHYVGLSLYAGNFIRKVVKRAIFITK